MILRTNKISEGTTLEEINGKLVLNKAVNIDPVLEANFHARKDVQDGWSDSRNMRRFASVPMETLLAWKKEFPEILSGDKTAEHHALKKIFQRPENEVFMTVEKKVGSTL